MPRVLVTGTTGFVGRAFVAAGLARDWFVRAAVRRADDATLGERVVIGDLDERTDWGPALEGIDVIVHLANRAHVMRRESDALARFRAINVEATRRLAEQAARAGVERLVYVSSVKVHGEQSDRALHDLDAFAPNDPYGQSKVEAEQMLARLATETPLGVVVVRPPLVYGPGVRANFLRLVHFAARGYPWPFGRLDNRRSLVFVRNLADALATCCVHPRAPGRAFLVSDGEDLSTPELLRRLARALGTTARQLPLSGTRFAALGKRIGAGHLATRLFGSLTVDSGALRDVLGWQPPYSVNQGLAETAIWYRTTQA